jgi:Flp pilus assembly protein TadG
MRLRGHRGATFLEFAMVAPALFLIVFGLMDFGLVYNTTLSLRQGVRDGARAAIVTNFGTDNGTGTSTCALTPSGGTGNAQVDSIICNTKARIGLTNSRVRVAVNIGPGGYVVGQPITVCAQIPLVSTTGLLRPFLNNKIATTKVQTLIETAASSPLPTGLSSETAPTGGSWSFCTVQ